MNRFLIAAALVFATGAAYAAGEIKAPKLASCSNFNVFKGDNGVTMGVCGPTKQGGKPKFLRSFVVVKVVDPSTNAATPVMVGFQ